MSVGYWQTGTAYRNMCHWYNCLKQPWNAFSSKISFFRQQFPSGTDRSSGIEIVTNIVLAWHRLTVSLAWLYFFIRIDDWSTQFSNCWRLAHGQTNLPPLWLAHWVGDSLNFELTDWLSYGLTLPEALTLYRLTEWFTGWLIYSLSDSLTYYMTDCLTNRLSSWLPDWLLDSLPNSLLADILSDWLMDLMDWLTVI